MTAAGPLVPPLWAATAFAAVDAGGPALAVVVPVRNEASSIQPLIEEIATALAGGPTFEIVYVDDGSDDATAEELQATRALEPRLRVVRHRQAAGQSAAIRSGILAAHAPLIATLDGDGQNDPANLPLLLQRFADDSSDARLGLIVGDRSKSRKDTWTKRQSSRVANLVRGWFLGDRTPDTGCGLKVFRRDAYLLLPYFDHQHRFLPALFLREGFTIRSVPVGHRPRTRGRSNYGTWDRLAVGIIDLWGVLWLRRRRRSAGTVEEL